MKLSIVTTLYCSSTTIVDFHRRVTHVAKQLVNNDYEIILVNDGSPDNSIEIAKKIFSEDEHVILIDLSRNFGQHAAMMTGIRHSKGEYVFALDDDLEEDPEWLFQFWDCLKKTHADHVYGVQIHRKGKFFERISGSIFYKLFNFLSDIKITPNLIMAKLMNRSFVNALIQFEERTLFLAGILSLTGFKQVPLYCLKKSKGRTSYTLGRKIEQALNSLISFSTKPLYFIFITGTIISFSSFLYLAYIVAKKLIIGSVLDGWTSIMAIMTLGFGITIAVLGVIGMYLAKIFLEVKKRPFVIIREILVHNISNNDN